MSTDPAPDAPLTTEQLAAAILKQVEFAEHSDEDAARNALREIAALCRRALGSTASTGGTVA